MSLRLAMTPATPLAFTVLVSVLAWIATVSPYRRPVLTTVFARTTVAPPSMRPSLDSVPRAVRVLDTAPISCPLCVFAMLLAETARLRPADSVPELVRLPVVVTETSWPAATVPVLTKSDCRSSDTLPCDCTVPSPLIRPAATATLRVPLRLPRVLVSAPAALAPTVPADWIAPCVLSMAGAVICVLWSERTAPAMLSKDVVAVSATLAPSMPVPAVLVFLLRTLALLTDSVPPACIRPALLSRAVPLSVTSALEAIWPPALVTVSSWIVRVPLETSLPCALFSDWPCTSSVVADEIVPCRLASVPVLTDTALPISAPLVFVRDWLCAVSVVPACSTPLAFVTAPAVASSPAAAAMAPPVLSSAPVPALTVTLRPATVPDWLPRLAADSAMSCAASSLPLALVTLPALVTVRLPPLEPSTPPAVLSRPATVALRLPAAATVPPWLTRLPAWIVAAPDAETAPRVLSSVPEPVLRFRPRAEIAPPWLPRLVAVKVASCAAMSLPLALAIPLALLMLNLPALEPSVPPALSRLATRAVTSPAAASVPPWLTRLPVVRST
ncbi:hypothetical protein GO284_05280 [Ralstonia solanacearum]|nr:hypothetical protein [Ralstonia solanacearum]